MVNHYGANNPIPYNNVSIKLGFMFRMICVIAKVIIDLIAFLNNLISILGWLPCELASFKICIFRWCIRPFGWMKKQFLHVLD